MSAVKQSGKSVPIPTLDDVQIYALGQEVFHPKVWLSGLERIGEKLARQMRGVVENILQTRVKISPEPIESNRFEDIHATLLGFVSLSLYRLHPLKGGLMVVIEPDFVASAVDIYYGGTGDTKAKRPPEFTPAEDRLITRLADGIVEAIGEAWAEIVQLSPVLASRETVPAHITAFRGDETVIVQRFNLVPVQGKATVITILYPLGALRPMESHLASKIHNDAGRADESWRNHMGYALESVSLPVRSVLARPEMTLEQILNLKTGDVIPVSLPSKVPLIVANKRVAMGTIGETNGHAALMVEQIEKGNFP